MHLTGACQNMNIKLKVLTLEWTQFRAGILNVKNHILKNGFPIDRVPQVFILKFRGMR